MRLPPIPIVRATSNAEAHSMNLRDDSGLIRRLGTKFVFDPDGCWYWTAASSKGPGYGVIRPTSSRKQLHAHRVMYELVAGPIPDGLQIDHLCREPRCVNPAHMEAVTQRVNVLRGTSPIAEQARRTHCLRGNHPLSGDNLSVNKRGERRCRTCTRELEKARRNARSGMHASSHVGCGSPLAVARP